MNKTPFDEEKRFMLEVWNEDRNYDDNNGSMLTVGTLSRYANLK